MTIQKDDVCKKIENYLWSKCSEEQKEWDFICTLIKNPCRHCKTPVLMLVQWMPYGKPPKFMELDPSDEESMELFHEQTKKMISGLSITFNLKEVTKAKDLYQWCDKEVWDPLIESMPQWQEKNADEEEF